MRSLRTQSIALDLVYIDLCWHDRREIRSFDTRRLGLDGRGIDDWAGPVADQATLRDNVLFQYDNVPVFERSFHQHCAPPEEGCRSRKLKDLRPIFLHFALKGRSGNPTE